MPGQIYSPQNVNYNQVLQKSYKQRGGGRYADYENSQEQALATARQKLDDPLLSNQEQYTATASFRPISRGKISQAQQGSIKQLTDNSRSNSRNNMKYQQTTEQQKNSNFSHQTTIKKFQHQQFPIREHKTELNPTTWMPKNRRNSLGSAFGLSASRLSERRQSFSNLTTQKPTPKAIQPGTQYRLNYQNPSDFYKNRDTINHQKVPIKQKLSNHKITSRRGQSEGAAIQRKRQQQIDGGDLQLDTDVSTQIRPRSGWRKFCCF